MEPRAPLWLAALALLGACSPGAPAAVAPHASVHADPRATPRDAAVAVEAPPERAAAKVREVRDHYFGTEVVDPYRWMEDPASTDFAPWLAGEAARAHRALAALPERDALLARIHELDHAGSRVWDAQSWGAKYFYLVAEPDRDARCLYVRDGPGGPERLLVDPAKGGTDGAIAGFTPSIDGRLVAHVSTTGVLRVVEAGTGRGLDDTMDRVQPGTLAWLPDGRSFFYTRLPKSTPGAAKGGGAPFGGQVHVHRLGEDPARDTAVFGAGVAKDIPLDAATLSVGVAPPGSRYVFASARRAGRAELTVYMAPRSKLLGIETPWRKLVDGASDDVVAFDVHGDDLFLLSRHDAPRGKLLRMRLSQPDLARASTLIPESERVLASIGTARDALYVRAIERGVSRLLRIGFKRRALQALETAPLPAEGTVSMMYTQPLADGTLFQLDGWTLSPRWYAWDPAAGQARDTGIVPPSLVDFSGIAAVIVSTASADGTLVPLSILHRKDLLHDSSHPTWLSVYAAYGAAVEPGFSPERLAWLERGGVYAVCHARGGGEAGDAWHRAATLEHKARSTEDLLACADYLIRERYTDSSHLGGEAWGAGAIPLGAAINQRPQLFGAALILGGTVNPLRLEATGSGALAAPELGALTTDAGFRSLLRIDVYTHVTPGARYPAILLTPALADPRSDLAPDRERAAVRLQPWQTAKLAARLEAATSSGKPVLLRVNDAGGSLRTQREAELADLMAFLIATLGG